MIGKIGRHWRGGTTLHNSGYIQVAIEKDSFFFPMLDKQDYILEHRLVMAKHLGRCLQSWEIVHHKNGVKDDNRIENLELTSSRGEHILNHSKGYRDGFQRGFYDGKDKRIKELETRIKELEVSLND